MTNLYPFLIYVFVTTFTPGPNNVLSMSNAMQFGYRKTLRFLAGIVCGFFVIMLLSGFLNVALATQVPALKHWLNILGALYLLYLAIHILRSRPAEQDATASSLNTFRAGFTLQFLNVKVILYGITVFSLFIIGSYPDPVSIGLFSALLAGTGFVATSSWALGGNLFRKFLLKNYRVFNIVMAGLLVYTAIESFFGF